MFYKLSNTSELIDIEREFNVTFKYPNLYEPKAIVNGLGETNVPVITMEDFDKINFAIWGLLPEDYDDEWHVFQDITNTLNTNVADEQLNEDIYSESLDTRRCLIIVNGFFTSRLEKGKLRPYHIHLEDYRPFCIAGVYNHTHDGFLTCSVLVTNLGTNQFDIPNIGKHQPLIFKKKDYKPWLNPKFSIENLRTLVDTHDRYEFIIHPIKEDFYNNTQYFKRIVKSDHYNSILKIARN